MSLSEQARAFRVAGQGLTARDRSPLEVLGGWAVQDSPPGAAVTALVARCPDLPVGWLERAIAEREAVALYNARTATAVVPAGQAAAFATASVPAQDAAVKAVIAPVFGDGAADRTYSDAADLAVDAISGALDGRTLSRDDLHEELRRRLPPELLPWCDACKSHHARRGLLVIASLRGRLCISGRAGRQPAFTRTDQWIGWDPPSRDSAALELVRRYLRAYGPSTRQHFTQWAGLGTAHAKELWTLVVPETADTPAGAVLERDLPRLAGPPPAPGVRLLGPGDPLLLGRDRETLVPSEGARKTLWRAINSSGLVLVDGEAAATWRARKQGRTLAVEVEPHDGATLPADDLRAEADRLAAHRGCAAAAVAIAG